MPPPFASRTSGRFANRHCYICDKTFDKPAFLAYHMQQHTGEKPFACAVDGCEKWYARKGALDSHVKMCHLSNLASNDWVEKDDEEDEGVGEDEGEDVAGDGDEVK